jgi:hypothetical protein
MAGAIKNLSIVVFALILSPTCPKAKFRKKNLFIQANSFIIFTSPNPVLLASGKWVCAKTACIAAL